LPLQLFFQSLHISDIFCLFLIQTWMASRSSCRQCLF